MATVQDCIDRARLELGDATTNVVTGSAITPRYPDADLLKYANDGIAKAYVYRPDLKFGSYGTAFTDLVATSSFPLPIEYRPAISAFIVARNQAGDDAFVNEQKAINALMEYMKGIGVA